MSQESSIGATPPEFEFMPPGWKTVRIGDVVQKKVDQEVPSGSGRILYVDIGSVDNAAKQIIEPKSIDAASAPSRARQRLDAGDVLVSMTRPNLNAVALVPPRLQGAIGSTGFDVLRSSGAVLSDWLFLIVRSKQFINSMSELVQGALYPAVRPADIRNYEIPLPPLAEQRRIVARLEALMARSRQARALLAEVPAQLAQARQSLLASTIRGDRGVRNWQLQTLPTIACIKYGKGMPVSELQDAGYPVFGANGIIGFTDSYHFEEPQVLISCRGAYSGKVNWSPPKCFVTNNSLSVIPRDAALVDKHWLFLALVAADKSQIVSGSAQPQVTIANVEDLTLKIPPIPEQREIVRRLNAAFARLDAATAAHATAVAELDRLDQALLARAFSGCLVAPEAALETARSEASASVKAQTYLIRFVPALLRAAGHPVSLDDLNQVVALRFLPASELLPVVERLGGKAARAHFAASEIPYEDGAFLAAMQLLLRTGAIAVSAGRRGIQHLTLGPKPPPSTAAVDADARYLAPLLSRIPAASTATVYRRLQSVAVAEALLATP